MHSHHSSVAPPREQQESDFEQASEDAYQQPLAEEASLIARFGEANPIYSGSLCSKQEQEGLAVALKIIAPLANQYIDSFRKFSIGSERFYTKQIASSQKMSQSIDASMRLSARQSSFDQLYRTCQLVYRKIDNSGLNRYRDSQYFTGLFVPHEFLLQSLSKRKASNSSVPNKELTSGSKPTSEKGSFAASQKVRQPMGFRGICNAIRELNRGGKSFAKKKLNGGCMVDRSCSSGGLVFDSNFECGNLFCVYKTGDYSYDLLMSNDTNSTGTKQWFYFSVKGLAPNTTYRFSIANFSKKNSLFSHGMKPLAYSLLKNGGVSPSTATAGWIPFGEDVSYYQGSVLQENRAKNYSVLSFLVNWQLEGDKIFFAHSYPYTLTRLTALLMDLPACQSPLPKLKPLESLRKETAFSQSIKMKVMSLGQTTGGSDLFVIEMKSIEKEPLQAIVIMARQHPGETQGSFVCEGVIEKLVRDFGSRQCSFLLQNYLVYIIPMVNPDGVVQGHYRSNLSGKDLNRKWQDERSHLTAEVSMIMGFLHDLTHRQQLSVRFLLDLHGHSKKLNSFFYGNPCPTNAQSVKMYPYVCSRLNEAVQFLDCTFSRGRGKQKAARVFLSQALKQLNVYTFESSFYGYASGSHSSIKEFTPEAYKKLGHTLVESMFLFLMNNSFSKASLPAQIKIEQIRPIEKGGKELKEAIEIYQGMQREFVSNNKLLIVGEGDSSESQSNPEEGEVNNDQISISEQKVQDATINIQKDARVVGAEPRSQPRKDKKSNPQQMPQIYKSMKQTKKALQYRGLQRPARNLKYLSISKVNAFISDQSYLSLQPTLPKMSQHQTKNAVSQSSQSIHDRIISPRIANNFHNIHTRWATLEPIVNQKASVPSASRVNHQVGSLEAVSAMEKINNEVLKVYSRKIMVGGEGIGRPKGSRVATSSPKDGYFGKF